MEGGALLVSGGRVVAAGRARDLSAAWPRALRVDLDGCALLPALVNGHCHLELAALGEVPPASSFALWLLEIIRRKRAAPPEDWEKGFREGLRACAEGGQGTVADVLSAPGAVYPEDGPEVLVFPEVIAPRPARAAAAVERALAVSPRGRARLGGLSPHSPYTACAQAYLLCAREAAARGGRIVTHVAETADEVSFCLGEGGDLVCTLYPPLLADPPHAPGAHPIEWLDGLGLLGPGTVLVHAVHLDPSHVATVAASGAGVILCPRSNRRFGAARAPGRALLAAGAPVGLGTDSRLSAGDLDLRNDVVAAVEDYGWSPAQALTAATRGAAQVLGLRDRGALVPGGRADILAVDLGSGRDPWERAVAGGEVRGLWLAGARYGHRGPAAAPASERE
ncbi:MAG: amidohydrolase family protein [Thermodesulfobacteriota bacterium]